MLDELIAKLSRPERNARDALLEKARAFIARAGEQGGVDAPVSKSWPAGGGVRVDLEVWVGRAFVRDR
jgi:hypothetical protein